MPVPPFESSKTQHVWLYPQRVNMLANPSFENNIGFWRANTTLSSTPDPAPFGGLKAANIQGGYIILESNSFPLFLGEHNSGQWTIHGHFKGQGVVRIGLVAWPDLNNFVNTDWGTEEFALVPDVFTHIRTLHFVPELSTGMVRIECRPTDGPASLVFDNVCCEPGWLPSEEWRYFDGDSLYGAPGDHSWYGGNDRQGRSYSCFYNNRQAVLGRLFSWKIGDEEPPPAPPTQEFDPNTYDVTKWWTAPRSSVLNRIFTPTGTQTDVPIFLEASNYSGTGVVPNMGNGGATHNLTRTGTVYLAPDTEGYIYIPASGGNSIYMDDVPELRTTKPGFVAEISIPDWSPATTDRVIASKWQTPFGGQRSITQGTYGFIDPVPGNGVVTTPHTATLRITTDVVISFRVRFNTATGGVKQYLVHTGGLGSPNLSWGLYMDNDILKFDYSTNGTATNTITFMNMLIAFGSGINTLLMLIIQRDIGGQSKFQLRQSLDEGVTWKNYGQPRYGIPFASTHNVSATTPMCIGNSVPTGGPDAFRSRIYWLEMRSDTPPPVPSTVFFRFDASDAAPSTTTAWPDPAGTRPQSRIWTIVGGVTRTSAGNGNPVANSWIFKLRTTGALQLVWSKPSPPPYFEPDAVITTDEATSTANLSALAADTRKFVGYTFVPDNGSGNAEIRFWTSDDGLTWTILGAPVAKPAFNLIQGTGRFEIAAQDSASTTGIMATKIYSFYLSNSVPVTGDVPTVDTAVVAVDLANITDFHTANLPTTKAPVGSSMVVQRNASNYVATMVPSYVNGGRAVLLLDGVDDFLRLADAPALDIPEHGTFSVWLAFRINNYDAPMDSILWKLALDGAGEGYQIWHFETDFEVWFTTLQRANDTNSDSPAPYGVIPSKIVSTGFRLASDYVTSFAEGALGYSVWYPFSATNTLPLDIGAGHDIGAGRRFQAMDFFAMVVMTGSVSSTEVANISDALVNGSEVYYNGDRWLISEYGYFQGLELFVDDVLIATHPTGQASPMGLKEVVWKKEVLVEGVVTDEEVAKQGLVFKWVPAGTHVERHDDVFFPEDPHEPVVDVAGTAITPYKEDPDDLMGVTNPWSSVTNAYLVPTIGTASTPDPVTMPNQVTFAFKVTGPSVTIDKSIASQWFTNTQRSWDLIRNVTTHNIYINTSSSGTSQTGAIGAASIPDPVGNTPQVLALSVNLSTGDGIGWSSDDEGETWTELSSGLGTATTLFNSTDAVTIGARGVGAGKLGGIWSDRIYWVELRTGLDPNAGTVLWRFDASDYDFDTTWTGPAGKVWTVTNQNAIYLATG